MRVKRSRKPYQSEVREAAADQTRERVVRAARELLGADDGPAFSLEAVARAAGVARLTVYNQFKSKRGLLEAAFDSIARDGGLFELPSVFAVQDPIAALRQLVSVFCSFWSLHGSAVPRVLAFARLDAEIAQSMRERSERRRHLLRALIGRLGYRPNEELIDVLFALTSFEFYESLQVGSRSNSDIEKIIQELAASAAQRYFAANPRRTT